MPRGIVAKVSASGAMSISSVPVKQAKAGMPSSRNSSRWSSPITSARSAPAAARAADSDPIAACARSYLPSQTSGFSSRAIPGSAAARVSSYVWYLASLPSSCCRWSRAA